MGDIFGFNDHDFSIVGINCHTHLGAIVMKNLELLVNVIMDFCKKNDIIDREKKSNENTNKLGALVPCRFQTILWLIDLYTKKGRVYGTPFLNSNISFSDCIPPLVGLKLGSDGLVETDHNNPQLRRDHDLFKSLPKFISRNNGKLF